MLYTVMSGSRDLTQKGLLLKQGILKNSWVLPSVPQSDSGCKPLSKESLLIQRKIYVPLNTKTNSIF